MSGAFKYTPEQTRFLLNLDVESPASCGDYSCFGFSLIYPICPVSGCCGATGFSRVVTMAEEIQNLSEEELLGLLLSFSQLFK